MLSKSLSSLALCLILSTPVASFASSSNCSSSVEGLEALARSAHFLPEGMAQKIFGTWRAKSLLGTAVITLSKAKGSVILNLKAKSRVLGIDLEDEGVATFCFTNQPEIAVQVRLFDKDESVKLRVEKESAFRVLTGRLKGLFKKQ